MRAFLFHRFRKFRNKVHRLNSTLEITNRSVVNVCHVVLRKVSKCCSF
jgi:hypothetical protein